VAHQPAAGLHIGGVGVGARGPHRLRSPERAMLVITHYQRLLNYIVPDKVHVMASGTIRKSGGKDLALELEETGYAEFASPVIPGGAMPAKGEQRSESGSREARGPTR